MAFSTEDCRRLLNTDPLTQGTNQGEWKRLSKRNGPHGVERVFSDKAGQRFALVVESQAGLVVQAAGSSLEELNAAPSGSVKAGPGSKEAANPYLETDRSLVAYAARLMKQKQRYKDGEGDDEDWWDTSDARFEKAHRAIANRFHFGVYGADPYGEDSIGFTFIPDFSLKEDDFCCPDYELQIDDLVPYPDISDTPNGTGDWTIRGFGSDEEGIKACIVSLIERGFQWNSRVQNWLRNFSEDPTATDWIAPWIESGMPGGKEALNKIEQAQQSAGPTSFDYLHTVEDLLQAFEKYSMVVTITPHAQAVIDPAFWPTLHRIRSVMDTDQIRFFLVPHGSELAQNQTQQDGPGSPTQWNMAAFVKGKRLAASQESIATSAYQNLVAQLVSKPPSAQP